MANNYFIMEVFFVEGIYFVDAETSEVQAA
jgi:hypothetical protein